MDTISISDSSMHEDEWDQGEEPQGINQGGQEPPKRINFIIDKLISKSLLNNDLINDVHNNELKLQSSKGKEKSILLPCPIISVDNRKVKKAREIHAAGLSSGSMIKKKSFVRKLEKYMNTVPHDKATNLIKLMMHRWQFMTAGRYMLMPTEDDNDETSMNGDCLLGCGCHQEEDHHYLVYQNPAHRCNTK